MTKLVSVPGADPFCEASVSVLPSVAEEMPEIPLKLTVTTIGLMAAVPLRSTEKDAVPPDTTCPELSNMIVPVPSAVLGPSLSGLLKK